MGILRGLVPGKSGTSPMPRHSRGRLRQPVLGKIIYPFGSSKEGQDTWRGVVIKAKEGSAVQSLRPGRVVYAGRLPGYGRTVIVDHTNFYMSVYTGLSVLQRQVGEQIRVGDVIGMTGTLESGEKGLYLEVRHLGKPIDPMTSW